MSRVVEMHGDGNAPAPHVVMITGGCKCKHCDQRLQPEFPIDAWKFIGLMRAFVDAHRHCIDPEQEGSA